MKQIKQLKSEDFPPTVEQVKIYDTAVNTKDNLIVEALAGAAKTSTLIGIANRLNTIAILCLAFNKRIAVEMQEKLPSTATAMTLNALGHRAWAGAVGKRLKVSTRKNYNILSGIIDKLDKEDKTEAYKTFAETLRSIAFGKACGYIPTGKFKNANNLMNDDDFYAHMEQEPSELEWALIKKASIISIQQAFLGEIDFDDQILMPTVFSATFPQYPLVMIDEAQDLSALNHCMLSKLVSKRIIAVGDQCQGIYGFRGAHQDSMDLMRQKWSMKNLTLTISFRCPISVVREARWRAPSMQWPDTAKEGLVMRLPSWGVGNLDDNTVIICRNNAPLFNMAISILKAGRYPELVGNDIGKFILKQLKSFGDKTMVQSDVLHAIDGWADKKMKKSRAISKVLDQKDCLILFANHGKTLGEAIAYAEHVMTSAGPIKLMTGHKSKGLEFSRVIFLDQQLIETKDNVQEQNLKYVIQTRATDELLYAESDSWTETGGGE